MRGDTEIDVVVYGVFCFDKVLFTLAFTVSFVWHNEIVEYLSPTVPFPLGAYVPGQPSRSTACHCAACCRILQSMLILCYNAVN